jgi:hypothetical protein
MMGMPMDPLLDGKGLIGAKAGVDLTLPLQSRNKLTMRVAKASKLESTARYKTVSQTLEENGPLFFSHIVDALGSREGREISVQLDELRNQGKLMRNSDGQYLLGKAKKRMAGLHGPQHDDPNSHT